MHSPHLLKNIVDKLTHRHYGFYMFNHDYTIEVEQTTDGLKGRATADTDDFTFVGFLLLVACPPLGIIVLGLDLLAKLKS